MPAFSQPAVPNGDFETLDPNSGTGALHWQHEGGLDICTVDDVSAGKGKHSMHMSRTSPQGRGFFYQDFPFTSNALRKYKISAAFKTQDLSEASFAGLGARVFDAAGNTISGYTVFEVRGNKEWKVYTGEFYTDAAAAKLRVFGRLDGVGHAWIDNITIQEIPLTLKPLSAPVASYLDEYFGIVREHSVVRDSAYITQLRQNTAALCAGHPDLTYCHGILKRYTTLKLNDGHSFFLTPAEWKAWHDADDMVASGMANFASGKMLEGNVAYLHVPTFVGLDSALIHQYVDSLQGTIARLDAQRPAGWIVDLSENGGGNSFAMLPGLGPLLGDGICGYSHSANGSKRTRIYRDGWAGWDETALFEMQEPYRLQATDPRIAVIYSGRTGSAGEVVAISFRGKANTRSFGQPTAGATTRVDNFELRDGAYLNLAAGYDVDRNGVEYRGPVPPDEVVDTTAEAIRMAAMWIQQ